MKVDLKNTLLLGSMLVGGATAAYSSQKDSVKDNITAVKNDVSKQQSNNTNDRTADFSQFRNRFESDMLLRKSGIATVTNCPGNNGTVSKDFYNKCLTARSNLYTHMYDLYSNTLSYDFKQNAEYQAEYKKQTFNSIEDKYNSIIKLQNITSNRIAASRDSLLTDMQEIIDDAKIFNSDERAFDIYDDLRTGKSQTKKLFDKFEQDMNSVNEEKALAAYKVKSYSNEYDRYSLSIYLGKEINALAKIANADRDDDLKDAIISLSLYQNKALKEEENMKKEALNTPNSSDSYKATIKHIDNLSGFINNLKSMTKLKDAKDYVRNLNSIEGTLNEIKTDYEKLIEISDRQSKLEEDFKSDLYKNIYEFDKNTQSMLLIADLKLAEMKNAIEKDDSAENTEDTTGEDDSTDGTGNTTGKDDSTDGTGNTTGKDDSTDGTGNTTGKDDSTDGTGNTTGKDDSTDGTGNTTGKDDSTDGTGNTTGKDDSGDNTGNTDVNPGPSTNVQNTTASGRKIKYFDLNGHAVKPNKPGLYILENGKKVLVK